MVEGGRNQGLSGRAAWTAAATEPRGGISASISRPSLTSALAMETTTFPASGSRSDRTVATALSQGVARTTSSAAAAPALSAPSSGRVSPGQRRATSPATTLRPLRVARADGHPDAGLGQPDRDPAPGRAGSSENSHVHAPTFA